MYYIMSERINILLTEICFYRFSDYQNPLLLYDWTVYFILLYVPWKAFEGSISALLTFYYIMN